MKHLVYILSFFFLGALFFMTGCQNQAKEQGVETQDSTVVEDSLVSDSLCPMIGSNFATEIFEDFFYEFVRNPNVQLHRIIFPLKWTNNGEERIIERKDWQYDPFYSKKDYYSLLCDEHTLEQEQQIDTVSRKVTYQLIDIAQGTIRSYRFEIFESRWVLVSVDESSWKGTENAEFLDFYQSFVADDSFQFAHVSNPFRFTSYDFDSDEELVGTLDAIQWPEFRPDLSDKVLTQIIFGDTRLKGKERIIRMTATGDGGMNVLLHFHIKRGKWMLVEQNNQ